MIILVLPRAEARRPHKFTHLVEGTEGSILVSLRPETQLQRSMSQRGGHAPAAGFLEAPGGWTPGLAFPQRQPALPPPASFAGRQ